jgi:hypothetical protein
MERTDEKYTVQLHTCKLYCTVNYMAEFQNLRPFEEEADPVTLCFFYATRFCVGLTLFYRRSLPDSNVACVNEQSKVPLSWRFTFDATYFSY